MVLRLKLVCAVVCRLNGVKNGQKIGLKLNTAARSVATTNNAGAISPATLVGASQQMTLGPQLHPANQQQVCRQR